MPHSTVQWKWERCIRLRIEFIREPPLNRSLTLGRPCFVSFEMPSHCCELIITNIAFLGNRWYTFDDENVSSTSARAAISENAYIMLYEARRSASQNRLWRRDRSCPKEHSRRCPGRGLFSARYRRKSAFHAISRLTFPDLYVVVSEKLKAM